MAKAMGKLPGTSEFASRLGEIEALQSRVREHVSAIRDLFARIAEVATGNGHQVQNGGLRRRRRRGRRRMAGASVRVRRGAGKRRAKRGELRAAIYKVLAGGKAARPAEIVRMLPKVGYETASNPQVFYNTVYLALKKDRDIQKIGKGFRLKK